MFYASRSPEGWSGGAVASGSETITQRESVIVASPNFEYLPAFLRKAIRRQLEAVGISQPRVLIVIWPERADHRDLSFNIPQEQFSAERYQAIMRSVSLLLPDGYQLVTCETFAQSPDEGELL